MSTLEHEIRKFREVSFIKGKKTGNKPTDHQQAGEYVTMNSYKLCESWTVKKAERRRIDAFELWC